MADMQVQQSNVYIVLNILHTYYYKLLFFIELLQKF